MLLHSAMLGVDSEKIFILTLFVLPFSLPENRPDLLWSRSHQVERQAAGSALARSPPSHISLYYQEGTSTVVLNHCNTRLALYMGRWILITWSFFEEPTYPMNYVGNYPLKGSVSSAAFVLDNLAMVIDQRLYIYSLYDDTWIPAQGLDGPVTTVSSLQCCFSRDEACLEVSSAVLLYSLGSPLEDGQVYLSLDGGFFFSRLSLAPKPNEFVGGVFNMPTVSSIVAMITNNQSMFSFRYISAVDQKQSDEQPMRDPLASLRVIQPAGMRGHLLIWSPHTLLYSPNHGVVIVPVYVIGQENATLPPPEVTILQVATEDNGVIAVLTSDGVLYYGRMALEAHTVRFSSMLDMSRENLLLFSAYGDLVLLRAHMDQVSGVVGFSHASIIVQRELTSAVPPVQPCPVEQFHSTFSGELFYIDMGSTVHLSAVYIPSPLCTFFPLVTVTDSRLLSSEEKCVEDGITPEGTKKYRLDIQLQQLAFAESEDGTIKPSPRKGSLSTLTVDLMGRHVSCKGLNPLKAHILVGCPPGKHIRVLSNVTACTKGKLSQEQLQDNFTYRIPKEVYDPELLFRPGSASRDLLMPYSITGYYCPLLVYHHVPWTPTLQLWSGDEFVEYVSADFVLFEVNGIHNYRYLQTAQQARCVSQPQNWTSQLGQQRRPDPHTAWTRDNYKSCVDSDGAPLRDPGAQYQVLNRASDNRLLFPNYNAMYIFKAIVVDPSYSYCELSSRFSVVVSGAFPPRPLPSGAALSLFLSASVLLLLWGFLLRQRYYT